MMSEIREMEVSEQPPLASRLRDGRPDVRLAALADCLLAERLSENEAAALSDRIHDPDPNARILAVEALGRCGGNGRQALVSALDASQPAPVRVAAASVLGRMTPPAAEAAEALAACLETDQDALRWHAASALEKLGRSAVSVLRPLIFATSQETALAALGALEKIGQDASDALEELKVLEDSEPPPRLRLACAATHARVTGDPSAMLPALTALLSEGDTELRKESLQRMADWGEIAATQLDAILASLADPDGPVRTAAAITLARLDVDPARVVPAVAERLDDPDVDVRGAAIMALAHWGSQSTLALPRLIEMQESEGEPLRAMVQAAVESIKTGRGEH